MGALPPVSPADFESAEVKPGDRACDVISKLSTLSRLSAEWYRWMMNDDQTPTRDYLDWTGAAGGTGLDAPSNVAATSNSTTKVTVTWGSVEGATAYRVFRGLTSDTRLMQQIGDEITTTSFEDLGSAETGPDADVVYFYAVKAFNATLTSGFSGTASGKMVTSTAPEDDSGEDYNDEVIPRTITVPEGKNRMEVELWGGGGRGGDGPGASITAVVPGTIINPGGGGASGSYYHLTGIVVTAGETFVLNPGAPGAVSRITRDADGTNAYATFGGTGGQGSYGVAPPGTPGAPASSAGGSSFSPNGTVAGDTTVGNAGDGSSGGLPVLDPDGNERGKGGDGSAVKFGTGSTGNGGRIRYVFTTAT